MPTAMPPFSITHDSPLTTEQAWARLTDWPAHGAHVPLTHIEVTTPGGNGVGTVFNARTGTKALGFDDPMEIVEWEPPVDGGPGRCRLEKRGSLMLGWAEITVVPHGTGSRSTWTEAARPKGLPRAADRLAGFAGKVLFGRVLRRLLAV